MKLDEFKKIIKGGTFFNPSKGAIKLGSVVAELISYKKEDIKAKYKIVIGTDSECREKVIEFVSVIAIHRIGKGGRYFWIKIVDNKKLDLRSRIYQEATISLALAGALLEKELEENNLSLNISQSMDEILKSLNSNNKEIILSNELEIHVDVGENGPTKAMIKEIIGMVRGSGFPVQIKPASFAASTIADRHL